MQLAWNALGVKRLFAASPAFLQFESSPRSARWPKQPQELKNGRTTSLAFGIDIARSRPVDCSPTRNDGRPLGRHRVAVEKGVPSYCQNRAMYFDPEKRELLAEVQPRKKQKKF
jgi:hypothetical protein